MTLVLKSSPIFSVFLLFHGWLTCTLNNRCCRFYHRHSPYTCLSVLNFGQVHGLYWDRRMNVEEDAQLSDSFDDDLVSFTPVASLVHEGNDTLSKGNTASQRLRAHENDGLSSEPPQKRVRHSDVLKNITTKVSMDNQSENDLDSASAYQNHSESPFANVDESVEKVGTHEFEIIDEVAADDDELEEGEQDSDESLDDTELYALLEEGITKDSISHSVRPIEREKVVLVGMYIIITVSVMLD